MNKFYVYSYLREDNSPYYIGKGTGKRAWRHFKNEIQPPKDKSRIKILKENLSEDVAHILEIMWIEFYGRKDRGTGILRNLTDGGEGASGRKQSQEEKDRRASKTRGQKRTEAQKENISKSRKGQLAHNKGKPGLSGKDNPMFGVPSPNTGKIASKETRNKISKSKKKLPKIECVYCHRLFDAGNLKRSHNERCKEK